MLLKTQLVVLKYTVQTYYPCSFRINITDNSYSSTTGDINFERVSNKIKNFGCRQEEKTTVKDKHNLCPNECLLRKRRTLSLGK